MWTTDTLWFEVAIVSIIFAIGNIMFGHFEEQTPKIRRIGKFILVLIIVLGISYFWGRTIAMLVLGFSFIPVIYIHTVSLPQKGINGWTGAPKEKYYELRGWDKDKLYFKKKDEN